MRSRVPSLADAVVPLLVAAVIVAAGVVHSGDARALPLVLSCAAGLSLFGRRRRPAATLAVSGALTLVLLHVEPGAGATAVIAPAVALYSLALRGGVRARVVAAVAAVAAVVVADALHGGGPTILQTLGHVLLVAIPLLIADVHRIRHANLALLQERLALAERTREHEAVRRAEQERLAIARDLHDVIAHTLTVINVQASTAGQLLERDPAHVRGALDTIEEASRDAIDELRAILGVLRGSEGGAAPLRPAPGLDDVPELVRRTREDGVEVRMATVGGQAQRVPEAVSLAAYRILQESLTNARRHAAGAAVEVTLSFEPDRVRVAIENGEGTPDAANGHGPGVGIMGMTERAVATGGTLTARRLARGFRVDAELPYARS
ncbi:sensor histidine kinase [Candidatus Solirubrobacter pratensis]|uniref:sensor histidine kinase n=1 Tax=Candidatus Solirubrobacter pratensis TaxID=1298857 RepID=UPI000414E923|nr:histidine kinase [Candidatus Solirubrobacter pratensis]